MKNKQKISILKIIALFLFFFFFNYNSAKAATASGYVSEGIAFYAYTSQKTGTAPIYRFYNKTTGDHYYKTSSSIPSGYVSEGIAFYAYTSQKTDTVPIYRFYNKTTGDHYYKTSSSVPSGYVSEGIAFYAYTSQKTDTVPVYKFYKGTTGDHLYTASESEKSDLLEEAEGNLGPEINVGLWFYTRDDLKESAFKIDANKDYVIKDKDGKKVAEVSKDETTKVKYNGDKNLLIYDSIKDKELSKEVRFEAKDGNNSNLILNVHRPDSSYDEYRGKIKLKYNSTDGNIWVINTLPIEQYVWGMGETTGTGPLEHTKVMTTIFRNYGYWYNENATKYLKYGFTIRSDSGSQIYKGYEWETKYPNIKKAATATKGIIIKYDGEVALTPYCSWSDGYTRRFEDGHWGGYYNETSDYKGKKSSVYPWLDSVRDPYGKHPSYSTKTLASSGNHMVGLIANGSVKLAGSSYKKNYDWILKYYYDDIALKKMY